MPPSYFVDGLSVATTAAVDLPGLGAERAGASPDWTVRFEDDLAAADLAPVEWTGDVRDGGEPWGRFGRRGPLRVVRLRGLFQLEADLAGRRAVLCLETDRRRLGSAFRHAVPYLAALDRRLVLHAACVRLPSGAVLLCGEAGTGKSTLALALDAAGLAVLSDDHVVVLPAPEGFVALPSFPFVEAADASRRAFRPEAPAAAGKAAIALRTTGGREPTGVAALAFLRRGRGATHGRVPAIEAAARLLRDVLFPGDPGDRDEHVTRLEGAARLAEAVPAWDVEIPEGLAALRGALSDVIRLLGSGDGSGG